MKSTASIEPTWGAADRAARIAHRSANHLHHGKSKRSYNDDALGLPRRAEHTRPTKYMVSETKMHLPQQHWHHKRFQSQHRYLLGADPHSTLGTGCVVPLHSPLTRWVWSPMREHMFHEHMFANTRAQRTYYVHDASKQWTDCQRHRPSAHRHWTRHWQSRRKSK